MKGSKTERRPNVWRLRVFVGNDPVTGAKRHASETFRGTERQAETALARFVTKCAEGEHGSPSMTFAGLLDAYVAHSEALGRSVTTIDSYKRHAENVRNGIGKTKLAKLQPSDLDELYSILGSRGVAGGRGPLSSASVRRHHAFFSAALSQAVKWGWLATNPAKRATPPTVHSARTKAPTPAELRCLIEKAAASREPSNAVLIALAAWTGARRGELAALLWSDVELRRGRVHFRRAVKQVAGRRIVGDTKTHAERTVALPAAAVDLLRSFRAQIEALSVETEIPLAADPFVFSSSQTHDRPLSPASISQAFVRYAEACGLSYHFHQLRHFAATQAIAAGFDPVAVAARLGHADPSVTLRVYSHALEDRDRAIAEHSGGIVIPAALTEGAK